jgi:CubicO group peptidase (beta-lactamase class C family)
VDLQAEVDRCIEQARSEWENIGAAVSVAHGDEVIYARGFGVREHGRPEPVDEHSVFQVGSTSKAFACAALGALVDEGRLGWDDPVVDHLPWFRLRDPWLTANVTVRDSLTHRSGIGLSVYPFFRHSDLDDTVGILRTVGGALPFRACFSYDNSMYAVAGRVTEAASGLSWHEFVKTRIQQPLAMTHSGTSPFDFWDAEHVTPTFFGEVPGGVPTLDQARDGNVAMPHGWLADGSVAVIPWQSYDNAGAAGAIVSNAADLGNWLVLHLNGGRFRDRQVLSEETTAELHRLQNTVLPGRAFVPGVPDDGYALGWVCGSYRGQPLRYHGGGILGFPSHVSILPDARIGVTVLSNGSKVRGGEFPQGDTLDLMAFHRAITLSIFDLLLGGQTEDWVGRLAGHARSVQRESRAAELALLAGRVDGAAPTLALERYAGTYEDVPGESGPVHISVEGDGLRLAFGGAGSFAARLEHWHGDLFRVRANPVVDDIMLWTPDLFGFVRFVVDAYGAPSRLNYLATTFTRKGA